MISPFCFIIHQGRVGGDFIINNRLREERLKQNKTIDEFANLLGVNKVSYYQYETGTRSVPAETAKEISEKLNISEDEIFLPFRYSVRELNNDI